MNYVKKLASDACRFYVDSDKHLIGPISRIRGCDSKKGRINGVR